MKPEQLKNTLVANGWQIETHGYEWKRTGVDWWAWKHYDGMAECTSNEGPPHIAIIPWEMASDPVRRSVEIEITGEVGNDHWLTLKTYSVEMDRALEVLPRATRVLIEAWNAAASASNVTARQAGTQ